MVETITDLLHAGGWISWPLVGVGMTMWTIAFARLQNLRRGFRGAVAPRVDAAVAAPDAIKVNGPVDRYLLLGLDALQKPSVCQHHLERFLRAEQERVRDYGLLLNGLVTIAPLLGLLGTVTGMIETFASMNASVLTRAAEQSMAGGISIALISTQLGLVIGVPGLAAARLLSRREQSRLRELAEAHSVLIDVRSVPP